MFSLLSRYKLLLNIKIFTIILDIAIPFTPIFKEQGSEDTNNISIIIVKINRSPVKIYKYFTHLTIQKNTPILKMGRGPEQIFFQRRHPDGCQAQEKMFNITNHHGNATQNHNDLSPHICQNDYYPKDNK